MSTKAFKALREFDGGVRYGGDDDDVGTRACCGVASYKPHTEACEFMAGLREYESLLTAAAADGMANGAIRRIDKARAMLAAANKENGNG